MVIKGKEAWGGSGGSRGHFLWRGGGLVKISA